MKGDKGIKGIGGIYTRSGLNNRPVKMNSLVRNTEKKGRKVREAAALRYSPDKNNAPEIVALGKGETAERIIKKAEEHDVPIYRDENLAHTLNYLKIGDEIPGELYEVVAQVLIFVSRLDNSYRLDEKIRKYRSGPDE